MLDTRPEGDGCRTVPSPFLFVTGLAFFPARTMTTPPHAATIRTPAAAEPEFDLEADDVAGDDAERPEREADTAEHDTIDREVACSCVLAEDQNIDLMKLEFDSKAALGPPRGTTDDGVEERVNHLRRSAPTKPTTLLVRNHPVSNHKFVALDGQRNVNAMAHVREEQVAARVPLPNGMKVAIGRVPSADCDPKTREHTAAKHRHERPVSVRLGWSRRVYFVQRHRQRHPDAPLVKIVVYGIMVTDRRERLPTWKGNRREYLALDQLGDKAETAVASMAMHGEVFTATTWRSFRQLYLSSCRVEAGMSPLDGSVSGNRKKERYGNLREDFHWYRDTKHRVDGQGVFSFTSKTSVLRFNKDMYYYEGARAPLITYFS